MTVVEDWTSRAACQGVDIDLFFDEERTIEARRLCLSCPVRSSCLSAAQRRDEPCGVWGGLTAVEVARHLDLSVPTVTRYWALARAWLHRELHPDA